MRSQQLSPPHSSFLLLPVRPLLCRQKHSFFPAYALDATYRVMAKTMGGAPQKLPRAGSAAFNTGSQSRFPCFHSLEGWLCLPGVWRQAILEIKTAPMDLCNVSAPDQSVGRHPIPGHQAVITFVVSDDLVVCRPQKWSQCASTHGTLSPRHLSNLLEAFGKITLVHGLAHASCIEWRRRGG